MRNFEKGKVSRNSGIVAENSRTSREEAVKIDMKSAASGVRFQRNTSEEILTNPKEKDLRSSGTVSKSSRTPKEKATKFFTKNLILNHQMP